MRIDHGGENTCRKMNPNDAIEIYDMAQVASRRIFSLIPSLATFTTPEDLAGMWFVEKAKYLENYDHTQFKSLFGYVCMCVRRFAVIKMRQHHLYPDTVSLDDPIPGRYADTYVDHLADSTHTSDPCLIDFIHDFFESVPIPSLGDAPLKVISDEDGSVLCALPPNFASIVDLISDGYTMGEIAEWCGVTKQRISYVLRKCSNSFPVSVASEVL